ncbi:3'-5' exonuclease [Rhizobium grahamii]|uniref:Transcriptional regulator protein n=2 Tax=Rhizobium grahamii TaxID=1120045 RepID=S3HNZ0_9HYPH|nr:transcriptional regulator [Rhizobium grahamii]EPE95116.1 transcriptional regulator protein [Rhizobium grahamii CCGE 502]RDJ07069.1 transcriptional regulator [Rhizobium grahamii]
MIVFLDFEASSLGKDSFPIEVAWVFQDGRSRSFLIRPAPDWTDWSPDAEAIHGISRDQLDRNGTAAEVVARHMMKELAGNDLYASAPSWDGKWLSVLLRAGDLPRHALRVSRSKEAFLAAARDLMGPATDEVELINLVEDVIMTSRSGKPASHRALPDAMLDLACWHLVRKEAAQRTGKSLI